MAPECNDKCPFRRQRRTESTLPGAKATGAAGSWERPEAPPGAQPSAAPCTPGPQHGGGAHLSPCKPLNAWYCPTDATGNASSPSRHSWVHLSCHARLLVMQKRKASPETPPPRSVSSALRGRETPLQGAPGLSRLPRSWALRVPKTAPGGWTLLISAVLLEGAYVWRES